MSKKQSSKKAVKTEIELTDAESRELEIILDRLSVQNPAGESLRNLLKSLRSGLTGRENLVAALIDRIAQNPSQVGFHAFLELQDLVQSKGHRRMIKQTAYRFAQRGYEAETEKALPPEKVVVIQKEIRRPVAHFVPADASLWFVCALIPESKVYPESVAVAVFAEERSRVNVREVEGSSKRYKELLQIVSDSHARPCEIPLWHAARLVNDLAELRGESPASRETARMLQLFEPYYDPRRKPYAYELMALEEEPSTGISDAEAVQLLNDINPSALHLPKKDFAVYRQQIQGVEQSLLKLPREVQEGRVLDLIRRAVNELCVGKTRSLYRRFFEEYAMWLHLTGSKELAVLAWKTALHLESVAEPADDRVAFHLAVLSLRAYWPEDFDEKQTRQGSGAFRETESGLILPR